MLSTSSTTLNSIKALVQSQTVSQATGLHARSMRNEAAVLGSTQHVQTRVHNTLFTLLQNLITTALFHAAT